jgi:putative ABC transport system ATP-binding protein
MVELPGIRFRDVHKSFPEGRSRRQVLSGVHLEVSRGERLAVVGRSGSGKSTLLHLIAGLERPDSGQIEVGGTRVDTLSPEESSRFRNQKIGMIFQHFLLIPTLTALENVCLPLELAGRLSRRGLQRAKELLEQLGLGDRGAAFPEELSGGEQQRVAIARALVVEPEVILADEPTGNLDGATAREVLALLERSVAEANCTLLLVTHSQEAALLADRVLRLDGGVLHPVTLETSPIRR